MRHNIIQVLHLELSTDSSCQDPLLYVSMLFHNLQKKDNGSIEIKVRVGEMGEIDVGTKFDLRFRKWWQWSGSFYGMKLSYVSEQSAPSIFSVEE